MNMKEVTSTKGATNNDMRLAPHIENILKERYYLKNESSWSQTSKRLAETILPEMEALIAARSFIPSTPTIMNLNTNGERSGTLSSCFILGIEDSLADIMDSMKEAAFVTKAAGGVGYNFSNLRGANENVKSISANSGGVMAFIGIFDAVLDGVRQGGRRRGAGMSMLSIYHPDILRFIDSKQKEGAYERSNFSVAPDSEFYDVLHIDPQRIFQTRNITDNSRQNLVDTEGKVYTYKMLWDKIIRNAWNMAEPGIFNVDIAADRCACKHITRNVFCNPCLTGDTLIYTADGRGNVPIKTLVDEGKDVPVFSMNHNGEIVVKTMMNPRLTQKQAKVFKVTFDSGLEVKATANHEFINTEGKRVELKDLKVGESIKSVLRHEAKLNEIYPWMHKTAGQDYYFIESNGKSKAEHRYIAEHTMARSLLKNEVVHHIDYNGKNNSADNLKVMTSEEHRHFHRKDMIGEKNSVHRIKDKAAWKANISKKVTGVNNPNSTGVTNAELVQKIKSHSETTIFGLMCKNECLKIEGFPTLNTAESVTKLRHTCFEGYCKEAGVRYVPGNVYHKLERQVNVLKSVYDFSLNTDSLEIEINKQCDCCKKPFITGFENRHVTYCSHSCLAKDKFKPFMFNSGKLSDTYLKSKNTKNRLQKTIQVFTTYKSGTFSNFKKECKYANSIIRPSNIFCPSLDYLKKTCSSVDSIEDLITNAEQNLASFQDKVEAAKAIGASFNHKVVAVEYCGVEDVYDGTVQDTHTILIGGRSFSNKWGKTSYEYITTGQCSEFVHIPYTSCNLGSINIAHFVKGETLDWEGLASVTRKAVVYLNGIVDNNAYPLEKIRETTLNVRPIGLGVMGAAHALYMLGIPYDSDKAYEFIAQLCRFITLTGMQRSMELAKENKKSYPYFDADTFFDANKRFFTEETFMGIDVAQLVKDIRTYGVYNSCITSIAPTGTISYIADCSGGIEPVFGLVFTRKIEKENKQYEHVYLVDPVFRSFVESKYSEMASKIYKYVSDNKGSCQGCAFLTKEEQWTFKVAGDISPDSHLAILGAAANNVSLSVSKTINLHKDCSEKDISDVMLKAHKLGIIGVTVYRDGCRRGILVHEDYAATVVKTVAPKRPKKLKGEAHQFMVEGKRYYVCVGLLNDEPYEVFTGRNDNKAGEIFIPKMDELGEIVKNSGNSYTFIAKNGKEYNLTNGHSSDTADAVSRLTSWGLRHGGDIVFAIEQLNKVEGSLMCYSKVLARTLKKYIKDNAASTETCSCGEKFIYIEGCKKCPVCGNSKCS